MIYQPRPTPVPSYLARCIYHRARANAQSRVIGAPMLLLADGRPEPVVLPIEDETTTEVRSIADDLRLIYDMTSLALAYVQQPLPLTFPDFLKGLNANVC